MSCVRGPADGHHMEVCDVHQNDHHGFVGIGVVGSIPLNSPGPRTRASSGAACTSTAASVPRYSALEP